MPSQSRVKFNPATREFEIEGTEAFVKKYFDKIQALLGSEKIKQVKAETSLKTVKTGKKIVKPLLSKKKAKMGTVQNAILTVFENVKDAIPVKDIIKKTGLNKSQVNGTLLVLKKKHMIKSAGRGMYKIVG